MVMDAGALGKKIQAEIQRRHNLPIDAADKNRKFEYIEMLNDDFRTAKFQAFRNSKFEEDCYLVQWDRNVEDPTKIKVSNSYHSDICDAVLYAWRECNHYFKTAEVVKHPVNSNAYMDALEAQEAEAMERKQAGDNDDWVVEQEDLDFITSD